MTKKTVAKTSTTAAVPNRVQAGKEGAPVAKATRAAGGAENDDLKPLKASIAPTATAAEVMKMIVSIKGRGRTLDNDIHCTALACIMHAEKHGDITLINRLLMAMPRSVRRNALAQWAVAFGKFLPNDAKDAPADAPLMFNKAGKTDMEGATAKPFWDFRNVKEGTTEWVFTNYIEGVMKTLATRAAGDSPEARKAKAAFDALSGVREALEVPANGDSKPYIEGKTLDRRGQIVPAKSMLVPEATAH